MITRSGARLSILVFIAFTLASSALFAQTVTGPQIVTINGNPLKINIAADASFQVFNAAVPGNGQIFPTSCNYGDMGVFADIGGTLFAPAFGTHTCGTATGGLGATTAWHTVSISQVQGAGEGPSPYTVGVTVTAPGAGVTMVLTVTYVNGDNFFRLRKQFSSAGNRAMKVFLGADIYLAMQRGEVQFHNTSVGTFRTRSG